MSKVQTEAEKQKTFYEILEQVVCNVTDKNLSNSKFREQRIANFHQLQKTQSKYAERLKQSSIVRPEDMFITYDYKYNQYL